MRHEKDTKTHESLVLGAFRYDRHSGQLFGADGEVVRMRRQSRDVLGVLATYPGEIVSKEKLFESVWPGIATTDDSLVQCIGDIRRILGREVVETFPKQGYRLCLSNGPDPPAAAQERKRWTWVFLACCLLLFAAASFLVLQLWPDPQDEPMVLPVVSPERTLAVLPFVNLGGNPQLRYFSDGLSEDLTTDLSKVARLTVISHASSFDFPDAEKDFRTIAEKLGVRYLVRGTVRHHADRVRINVSLIDPYDGFNLWADRFDWDKEHPFEFQEVVTGQIVQALSLKLDAAEADIPRVEADAYYMLLRGLEPLRAHTAQGNVEAREYFERAVQLEPEYARAYANIAITYGRETVFRYTDVISGPSIEKGLEAAVTAIRLDHNLPDAYFALGVLNQALGEYANALAAARHAIRIDGNYSNGYALLAEVSINGGDLDEALAAIQRAKLLHPRYPFTYDWIEGHALFQLGRYDEAQQFLEKVAEYNPDFYLGLIILAANYGQQGDSQAASSVLSEVRAVKPGFDLAKEMEKSFYLSENRKERFVQGLIKANIN